MLLKRSNNKLVIEMNMAVPEEVIERIRNDNDIVEVVEDYVQLKKQGQETISVFVLLHDEITIIFRNSGQADISLLWMQKRRKCYFVYDGDRVFIIY